MSERPKRSIKGKLLGGVLVLGALMTSLFAIIVVISHGKYLELNATRAVESSAGHYDAILQNDTKMLSVALDVLAQSADLKRTFAASDRDRLFAETEALFRANRERYGISHFYFLEPDGTTFLRVHKKEQFGDKTTRVTFQQARDRGATASGIELGKNAFALRVVTPYFLNGQRIGFVELGEEIDHFDNLLKKEAGVEVITVVEKKHLVEADYRGAQKANNKRDAWGDLPSHVVMSATVDNPDFVTRKAVDEALLTNVTAPKVFGTVSDGSKTYSRGAFPLKDAAGRVVGSIIVLSDVSVVLRGERLALALVLGVAGLLVGLMTWLTYRYLGTQIIAPLTRLTERATVISMGKVDQKLETDREDEIGLLIRSFERMRVSLMKSLAMLQG